MKRLFLLIVAALCLAACSTTKMTNTDLLLKNLSAYESYNVRPEAEFIWVSSGGSYGLVDYRGNIVIPVQYRYITPYPRLELIAAQHEDDTLYLYSFDGKLLAHYADTYETIEDEESFVYSLLPIQEVESGAIGIVGKGGKLVQPFRFDEVGVIDSNQYYACEGDSLFILDVEGRITRRSVERWRWIFKDKTGRYNVNNKEGVQGLFDDAWRELLPFQYQDITYYPQYGYYVVHDTAGVSHLLLSDLTALPPSANGSVVPIGHSLFVVYHNDTTSLIHLDGRIEQTSYKYIYEDKSWLIAIDNDNTYYLLDSNANPIVKLPTKFGNVSPIDSNHAMIYDDDAYVIIDRRGQQLVRYDDMVYNLGCSCHPEYANFIAVSRDGRWGYIDRHCNEIIPLRYKHTYSTTGDKLFVIHDDGTSALLDSTGHTIITAEGMISEFLPGIYSVDYYEEHYGIHTYLILPDGRTNATPEQREAARNYNMW